MSDPTDRAERRLAWTRSRLGDPGLTLVPASADASFRSYWRTRGTTPRWIVMDSPPALEDPAPWLAIGERLRHAGLHAPAVRDHDLAEGFLLIEDLGDRLYLPELTDGTADALYDQAIDALLRMQSAVRADDLPPYDRAFLQRELELMPEWFLQRHLGITPTCGEWDVLEAAFTVLLEAAAEQPRVFVHRDYHSRNLLVLEPGADTPAGPGIIDFQGALYGPLAYDLASLLRDCYIVWEPRRVHDWMESYRRRATAAGLIGPEVDAARFERWFDLIGLQRHLKVLGIFCRLWYRDGKAGYLGDLPRVLDYVLAVARRYPELATLADLLERSIGSRDVTRPAP